MTAVLTNPLALSLIGTLVGGMFNKSPRPVPLPEPKAPPRPPITASDTSAAQRAGVAVRARARSGGIRGLRLSLGKSSDADVTRKTLVGA